MPGFHELTYVRAGQGVPGWRDIMALDGADHQKAIGIAAQAVWSWMHARAQQGDPRYVPAFLDYDGSKGSRPQWGEGSAAGAVAGWRWDGVISSPDAVFAALWPSISGLMRGGTHSQDPDERLAGTFRVQVSTRLKYARNVVCVVHGGSAGTTGDAKITPQWFIAAEYSSQELPPGTLKKNRKDAVKPGSRLAGVIAREEKVTPEEAGESRDPAEVTEQWACRHCTDRFKTEPDRDLHEMTQHAPESELPEGSMSATIACRKEGCNEVFSAANSGNRRIHEMRHHPEIVDEYYPLKCPVAGCSDPFNTTRGLSNHLGTRGHGITDLLMRDRLIDQALDKATRAPEDEAGTEEPAALVQQPEPAEAVLPAASAPGTLDDDVKALDALTSDSEAVEYILKIVEQRRALEQENEQLRARLAAAQARADSALTLDVIKKLFEGGEGSR